MHPIEVPTMLGQPPHNGFTLQPAIPIPHKLLYKTPPYQPIPCLRYRLNRVLYGKLEAGSRHSVWAVPGLSIGLAGVVAVGGDLTAALTTQYDGVWLHCCCDFAANLAVNV
jgi:hypothetical protein